MNKNVKRIVAMALAIGTVSAVAPATNLNLLTTKAYASSDDADEIDSIDLQDDDGGTLDLYEDSSYDDEYTDDLDEGDTYYTESTTDRVSIDDISGADEDNVRIFLNGDDDYDDAYEVGDNLDLDDGINKISIRVYEDAYDDMDESDLEDADYNEYKIRVDYDGDEDEDDSDDENDEDTLDSLDLLDDDGDSIQLYSDDNYDDDDEVDSDDVEEGETYYAQTSSGSVSFDADGDVDDDYIRVFKSTSDSAKGYDIDDDISVSGDKTLTVRIYDEEPDDDVTYEDDENVVGEYEIKLEYTDDDSTSTSTTTTATSTPNTATNVTTVKPNQWIQTNGIWKYNDAAGNTVKNSWVQGNYYVQADGSMATGWLINGGSWYYLGANGAKQTGWKSVGGTWYYLDSQGKMQTGWMKDMDGKYYYLNSNGSMAYNTTIGGYKLGASGAWIK